MASTKHIGIILDGNRRFAKKIALQPWKGHEKGADTGRNLIDWAWELGIKELTLYVFSLQNFQRAKEEVDYLMNIFKERFTKLLTENLDELNQKSIRIKFLGRRQLFADDIVKIMNELEEKTKTNNKLTVNFAMAYGGREEIVDAVKQIAKQVEEGKTKIDEIDEQTLQTNLYLTTDPDLVIRTGGEKRTSNFFPWQTVYSEWFFIDKYWPEFTKEDLINILKEFEQRERRFGK